MIFYEFFSAVVCSVTAMQFNKSEQWTTEIIDQILIEGDKLYFNGLENRIIPDTETLSLNCIHCLPEVHLFSITKDQYQLLKYL
jgi:hypothetical protein